MTTHQIQDQNQNFFHLITLTVPVAKSKKAGFQSAIVSSIYIDGNNFSIDPDFYERMYNLGLRNFSLVIINHDIIGYDKR
jgi:hypothetical protein